LILEYQGKDLMAGLLPEGAEQRSPQQLRLAGYKLNITYHRSPLSRKISRKIRL